MRELVVVCAGALVAGLTAPAVVDGLGATGAVAILLCLAYGMAFGVLVGALLD